MNQLEYYQNNIFTVEYKIEKILNIINKKYNSLTFDEKQYIKKSLTLEDKEILQTYFNYDDILRFEYEDLIYDLLD